MTDHRARTLCTLLPVALATGYSEVEPDFEPFKVRCLKFGSHQISKQIFRTLTQTSKSKAMIPTRTSPSLGVNKYHQSMLKDISWPCLSPGTRARHDNLCPTPNGSNNFWCTSKN